MRKKILIPTDFTLAPLLVLKNYVTRREEEIDVVFFYNTMLTDSITDLLFYSPKEKLREAVTKEFREGYTIMQNKYANKIHSINVEIFFGNTREAFSNFTKAQKVDEIVTASDYRFDHGKSISPLNLIRNANIPVVEINLALAPRFPQKDMIAALLAY